MITPAIKYGVRLQVKECPSCFVIYAVPVMMMKEKEEDGGHWYCPNGHSLHYIETKVIRLNNLLEQANVRNSELTAKLMNREKELKRTKLRISKGVCPCCNRTFQNLMRHMKTKHADEDWRLLERKIFEATNERN